MDRFVKKIFVYKHYFFYSACKIFSRVTGNNVIVFKGSDPETDPNANWGKFWDPDPNIMYFKFESTTPTTLWKKMHLFFELNLPREIRTSLWCCPLLSLISGNVVPILRGYSKIPVANFCSHYYLRLLCCGSGAALFGRSRSCEKKGGSGSSSTVQAPALTLCLKKRNKQKF